jgi:hypothetical protein
LLSHVITSRCDHNMSVFHRALSNFDWQTTMSKIAHRQGAGAPKRSAATDDSGELRGLFHGLQLHHTAAADVGADICPICKSARYLNPNMRFLINSECYHRLCESCVERIFSHGPAVCPYPACNRTLRHKQYRLQTFEDVRLEKEMDIRAKVANV